MKTYLIEANLSDDDGANLICFVVFAHIKGKPGSTQVGIGRVREITVERGMVLGETENSRESKEKEA